MAASRQGLAAFARTHPIEILICLGLAVAVLLVFAQVAGFDFIDLDDVRNVVENPALVNGFTLDGVAWAFTDMRFDYWQPVTWLSHMLDVQLFGMRAGWHHLTSVFIHLINAILVFIVLRRMTGALWRSAIVAALFAIHPLRAESVVWVTERKDVLGGLFWWLATWAYVAYTKKRTPGGSPVSLVLSRRYGLVVVLFILGLMAKPVVMTLPFFLLLLDYWPLKRIRLWGQPPVSTRDAGGYRHVIIEKIPLFLLSGFFVFLTFKAQHDAGAWMEHLSFPARIANGLVAYAAYLLNAVWPYPLAAIYPYNPHLPAWRVALAGLSLAIITVLVIWKAARLPYLAVGWFWYLGVLVPVIGLVQLGFQSRADRFTYIPLIGFFVMVVWGLHDLMAVWRHRRAAAIAMAAIVLPALGARAWSQVGYWHDSITLFRQNLTVAPDNAHALSALGRAFNNAGRYHEGFACSVAPQYWAALEADPSNSSARRNLEVVLSDLGMKHARETIDKEIRERTGTLSETNPESGRKKTLHAR